jgi:hypothetical protein
MILSPVGDSVVLKVITIYNKDTDTIEEVLLEELQVFKVLLLVTATMWQTIVLAHIKNIGTQQFDLIVEVKKIYIFDFFIGPFSNN